MTHFDIIVSGCGPTGGVIANLLAAQGLSVCIVERFKEVYPLPRAIVLDWEVMRALQYCGVAHTLHPSTRPHPGTDFIGVDGGVIKLFDPAPPPYPLGWPATSTFIQPELEQMLRRALRLRRNAVQKYGSEVSGFSEGAEGVTVTVTDNDTGWKEELTAEALVACEGANSLTRESLGYGLEDFDFDEWWVVVDAWQRCDTDLPRKTTQYCWPSRPATYVVGPGNLRRWEIKMLPGEQPHEFNNPTKLREVLSNYVDVRCFDVWRSATYRFSARVGDRWQSQRVFLAGDAVHQTPPFLGQGLCAGVRDAFNLAWKIVHMHRHGWNDKIVASYQEERKPHVAKIIHAAKEFGLIIGEMDEAKALERDRVLRAELDSGRMITTRQAFIPNLADGILGEDVLSGSLMVQPEVKVPKGTVLMDDLTPMEFLFVTEGTEAQGWMQAHAELWHKLHGAGVAFISEGDAVSEGVLGMVETGNTFSGWAKTHGVRGVLVRPDRYVYSGVTNPNDLAEQLKRLAGHLGFR